MAKFVSRGTINFAAASAFSDQTSSARSRISVSLGILLARTSPVRATSSSSRLIVSKRLFGKSDLRDSVCA